MKKEKTEIIHTSLYIEKPLWLKIFYLAKQQRRRANDLVIETLKEKFQTVEVIP
jgi:hypothetical protein